MNNKHLNDFINLAETKNIDLGLIIQTYEHKATQYLQRDNKNSKQVLWMQAKPQYERAYKVIMKYYEKKV